MSTSDSLISFYWKKEEDRDRDVWLACSTNWEKHIKMPLDESTGHHRVAIDLPPGKHLFKFVIDRGGSSPDWECDPNERITHDDEGNENNYVEVEEYTFELDANNPEGNKKLEKQATIQKGLSPEFDSPSPSLKNGVEIERKFSVPNHNYKEVLEEKGFEQQVDMTEELNDFYYDDDDQSLMKADLWLRNRNGYWEMKYPVLKVPHPHGQYEDPTTTTYHETTSTTDIVQIIRDALNSEKKAKVFEDGMKNKENTKNYLCCYAFLHTIRETYTRKNEDDLFVVVDKADWGYRVAEVEVVIRKDKDLITKAEIEQAIAKVDSVAESLGVSPNDRPTRGKLEEYLRLNNVKLYEIMRETMERHREGKTGKNKKTTK